MVMSILGAIELYLGIQSSMELELKQSKEFYTLAIDLYKTLALRRENRGEDGKDYLNKKYAYYIKLCEASNLLKRKMTADMLTDIPDQYEDRTPTSEDEKLQEPPYLELPLYHQPRQSISVPTMQPPVEQAEDTDVP